MTNAEITYAVITIIAIIAGPIAAVAYTRWIDNVRQDQERKLWVFRMLMGTRSARLSNEHVTALNLVMVEFHKDADVIVAFKQYVQHLSSPLPAVDEQDRHFEHREDLFTTLLQKMGTALGYNFDGRELGRLSYGPQGWANDQDRQRRVQMLLIDLLEGKRPIGIATFLRESQHNPFPPPPTKRDG